MTLLEFARGPMWWIAVGIFSAGSAWRLWAIFRLPAKPDFTQPRSTALMAGAARSILGRMIPKREFRPATAAAVINGYVYHIGLAIIALGYVPHIRFIERVTGLSWPPLPEPVVYLAVACTFVSLIAALVNRITHPVLRMISSPDDYFSWLVVFLPLVTGMAALSEPYGSGAAAGRPMFELPLALHLLSVELLLIWLPFGKLAHAYIAFVSRGITGAALARKGVRG